MNTFATGSLPVHFSVAKLFNFRWQYTYDIVDYNGGLDGEYSNIDYHDLEDYYGD